MSDTLTQLSNTIDGRKGADPSSSYVAKLLAKAADLWFHTLVALSHYGLSAQEVLTELARREGLSGIAEKAARKP